MIISISFALRAGGNEAEGSAEWRREDASLLDVALLIVCAVFGSQLVAENARA